LNLAIHKHGNVKCKKVKANTQTILCHYRSPNLFVVYAPVHCRRQGVPCSRLTHLEQAAATHNLSTVTADIQEEAEVLSVWPQFLVVICFPEL